MKHLQNLQHKAYDDRTLIWLLYGTAFCIPFNSTQATGLLCGLLILAIIVRSARSGKFVFGKNEILLFSLFLIHVIWAIPFMMETGKLNLLEKTLTLGAFPVIMGNMAIGDDRLRKTFLAFISGTLLAYGWSLIRAVSLYLAEAPTLWGRQSDLFFHLQLAENGVHAHPTYFALIGCIATLLTFYFFGNHLRLAVPAILFLTLVVLLLDSRVTSLLQLAMVTVAAPMVGGRKNKLLSLVLATALLAAIAAGYTLIRKTYDYSHRDLFTNLSEKFDRSLQPDVNEGDGGIAMRLAIWRFATQTVQANPWFGVGFGREVSALTKAYQAGDFIFFKENPFYNAHNQYLSHLIVFGIVGTALFYSCLVFHLIGAVKKRKWAYVIFVAILALSFVSESLLNRFLGISIFSFFNTAFVLAYVFPKRA